MAFESQFTRHYRLPYFAAGQVYSAEGDRRRFVTLDRNLDSYIGIVGDGVLTGWAVVQEGGLSVSFSVGTGFINGYFSESGFIVKKHSDVGPGDVVISYGYYTDPATLTVYDKIFYKQTLVLPDESDCYVYAYRNSNYAVITPYYEPDNAAPVPETSTTTDPVKTAVAFSYASSKSGASSSGKLFLGMAATRAGAISWVDLTGVPSVANMESAIYEFGEVVIKAHRHGGKAQFDPPKIRLQVDRRNTVLSQASESAVQYTAEDSNRTTLVEAHNHSYFVDSLGSGTTISVYGNVAFHFHTVDQFVVGGVQGATGTINSHAHELDLPEDQSDGWNSGDPVQIYINRKPYSGDKATINAAEKTVTFTGDVTAKLRRYGASYGPWAFEQENKSLYNFMLAAALDYIKRFPDSTPIILADPATPATALKYQAMVAEPMMTASGDTFTFTEPAASNVTAFLIQAEHVDTVEIEILLNSEIQGQLPIGNILYIPASKITSGKFAPESIPLISHIGRVLELCSPRTERCRSTDGRMFAVDRTSLFSNVQAIYSAVDDGAGGYLLGTSDGLYAQPVTGAYLWVINGVQVVTSTGDIGTRFEEASVLYQSKTGDSLIIDSGYDAQVAEAETVITAIGSYYKFTGAKNDVSETGFDTTWLYWVQQYRLTSFGYQTTRKEMEILPGEEIVEEIMPDVPEEGAIAEAAAAAATTAETGEEVTSREFLVKNDFQRYSVKRILAELKSPLGYSGGVLAKYFALSSELFSVTTAANRQWDMMGESWSFGYMYDAVRTYSGSMLIGTSNGLKLSLYPTGVSFRPMSSPALSSEAQAVGCGYGTILLSAFGDLLAQTSDYGQTWATKETSGRVSVLVFDPTLDVTSVVLGHSHSMVINALGDGETSEASGHVHAVSAGQVTVANGHTHSVSRTFYAVTDSGFIYKSSDTGLTWADHGRVPISHHDYGRAFAGFGKLYVPVPGKVIATTDGSAWTDIDLFGTNVYSGSWNWNQDRILVGGVNVLYSFDGTEAEEVYAASGWPMPAVFLDKIEKKFGWLLNTQSNSFDMGGRIFLGVGIDAMTQFAAYYPEQDGWTAGTDYELYLNDRLLKSTRKMIDRSQSPAIVDNAGLVSFSVYSAMKSEIKVGDTKISLVSAFLFPSSGTVKMSNNKTEWQAIEPTFFFDYVRKDGDDLVLSHPSIYGVKVEDMGGIPTPVYFLSPLGADDVVRLTVYDGKLTSIGDHTHYEVEDGLHMEDIGLDKKMSDVYLSNLTHLTVATKYIFPSVDDEMSNRFISMFDYNDTPGDPNNIDRWIDRSSSDLASLAIYKTDALPLRSSSLRRFLAGFGSYSGMCFAASNIGLFVAKCSDSLDYNWFRIDVDGESSAYDVLQYTSDSLYVATDKGTYVSSAGGLDSWTQLDESVVGGEAMVISPRWTTLVDEGTGIDYWWGDWNGVTHPNSALINSLLLSGAGFVSVSDDRGLSWQKGFLPSTWPAGLSPLSYTLLRNGGYVGCFGATDGSFSGVAYTTGTGISWQDLYSVGAVAGTINSIKITESLNAVLSVVFSANPPADDALVGRLLVIGDASYPVIGNGEDWVKVFGDSIVDSATNQFSVRSPSFNVLYEDSEKRLSIGGSTGILSDSGGFFSAARRRDGRVLSLGNRAVIASVNISGLVKSSFSSGRVFYLSSVLDRKIGAGSLKGQMIKFKANIPSVEVINNTAMAPDGTTTLSVADPGVPLPAGSEFQIVGKTSFRIYVAYDGIVAAGQLSGGSLVLEPTDAELAKPRNSIAVFSIVRNTEDYIELDNKVTAPEGYDPLSALVPGAAVYATNSDGTAPVVVQFDTQRRQNELAGFNLSVRGTGGLPPGGKVSLAGNDEISVLANETFVAAPPASELTATDDGQTTGATATYSIYNTLLPGSDFYLSGVPFMPSSSFTNQRSSESSGHYHVVSMVPGPITATVASILAVTATTVELQLTSASGLSDPFVLANPALFKGQDALFYDPASPEVSYRLEIVSLGSASITVLRRLDAFNYDGTDPKKVGAGYGMSLTTVGFGRTVSTQFASSYVVSRSALVADALLGATVLEIPSSAGFVSGSPCQLADDRGSTFDDIVSAVPDSTHIVLSLGIPYDMLVENGARIDLLYGVVEVLAADLAADAAVGATIVSVTDTTGVVAGDYADFYDLEGLYLRHVVQSVGGLNVTVSPGLPVPLTVAGGAYVSFRRRNADTSHEHFVRESEFSVVKDEARAMVGDPLYHSHYLVSKIPQVLDMRAVGGTTYAVGSGSQIMVSNDNGDTWQMDIDLAEVGGFSPVPTLVSGIFPSAQQVVFGTSSGYFVYKSTQYEPSARPLAL